MCSDAPDMSGMNAAAAANAEIAKEALAWYKQKDAEAAPLRDAVAKKALEVSDAQLTASKQATDLAADYDRYNKGTFRPLEQGIVADAQSYDTPEKRNEAATAAMADVSSAGAAMREARARRLAAQGIDPGSTRAIAALDGADVEQAKNMASAAYAARKGVEATGFARKMDAASLGRNLPSAQATSAQLAMQGGTTAVQTANTPVSNANQGTATYGAGFGAATSANASAGSIYGQSANITANADNALWGALGSLGGAAISTWGKRESDENLKTDVSAEDPEQALREVTGTPVKSWRYDPAKLAAKGIEVPADELGQNTGPMAQDAQATMGDKVAPSGKQINMGNMLGKVMLSVQALDKKINSLTRRIAAGGVKAEAV